MSTYLARPSNDTDANRAFGVGGHHGTDWGWGQGDAVYAMADGRVAEVKTLSDYGKIIRIDHGGLIAASTSTRYCHLSAQSVKVGDAVKRGQQIGVMGATGSLLLPKPQKHLHSELWLNGIRVDEQPYQKKEIPIVSPDQRTVGPVEARRRVDRSTNAAIAGPPWGVGTVLGVTGYQEDLDPKTMIGGTNKWFLIDGLWSHASAFTDSSTTGLTNLAPVVPPSAGATKADVQAIVSASEAKILAAIAAIKFPTKMTGTLS